MSLDSWGTTTSKGAPRAGRDSSSSRDPYYTEARLWLHTFVHYYAFDGPIRVVILLGEAVPPPIPTTESGPLEEVHSTPHRQRTIYTRVFLLVKGRFPPTIVELVCVSNKP